MIIRYLELYGYIRFELNNITLFKFNPTKQIQLIIGTNGSGKSSLINELSPLPADHTDFRQGGYKIIKIDHNGSRYELISDFSVGRKHRFFKDGVNLNEGGTVTIQKELVRQHFDYDMDIHVLLTGEEQFHKMSTARRREWIIRLCTANYDYAVSVFSKIKETLNYTTGALRNYRGRLVEEQSKLISKEKNEEYLQEKEFLMDILEKLFSLRSNDQVSLRDARETLDTHINRIIKIANHFLNSNKRNIFGIDFKSKEDIDAYGTEIYAEIKVIESKLEQKVQEYDKSSKLLEYISSGEKATLVEIREKLTPLYDEIKAIKANKVLNIETENVQRAIDTIELIESIVAEIFQDINLEYKYANISILDRYTEERDNLKDTLVERTKVLEKINSDIRHMEHQKNGSAVECPKCRHSWVVGYSEESYLKHIEDRDKQIVLIEEVEKKIETIEVTISGIKQYLAKLERYNRLVRDYQHALGGFWNYVLVNKYLDNPRMIVKLLNQYKMELHADFEISIKENSIGKLNELYQKLIDEDISNVEDLKTQILNLENAVSQETQNLTLLKDKYKALVEYNTFVNSALSLRSLIADAQSSIDKASQDILDSIQVGILNKHISFCQVQLANIERSINQFNIQQAIIHDIEKNIAKLEKEEQCAKILIKELSPTEGLIAEGLHGFIVRFVDSLNKIISKVWTYPLEVLPCSNVDEDSVELDYKFPLSVNGSKPKYDISCGSTAMKEIINLGFRLTAIKYLKHTNGWLALDEFSSSMDNAHKLNVIDLIKSLMEFSQIFIVNHFYTSYTAFNDAEICALSSLNIMLPEKYNQHIEIS